MAKSVKIIANLKDARIYKKENQTIITGEIQNPEGYTETIAKLDDFGKIVSSHLGRVMTGSTGEHDGEKETNYITVKTTFDLPVGADDGDTIVPAGWSGELVSGDFRVRLTFKTVKPKDRNEIYLAAYPSAVVLPADWKSHIVNEFEGF